MTKAAHGGNAPGKGAKAGEHGGNRGGGQERRNPDGPRNDRQAQGKDPQRGQPG